jgi:hypothetical protein
MGALRSQLQETVGIAVVERGFVGLSVVVVAGLPVVGLAVTVLVWRALERWIVVVSAAGMCVLEARGLTGWLVGVSSCWMIAWLLSWNRRKSSIGGRRMSFHN